MFLSGLVFLVQLCFGLSLGNTCRSLHLLKKPHAILLKQQMKVSLIIAWFNLAENVKSRDNKGLTVLHSGQLAFAYHSKQLQAFSISVHIKQNYLRVQDLNTHSEEWQKYTFLQSILITLSLENHMAYTLQIFFHTVWRNWRDCFKLSETPATPII